MSNISSARRIISKTIKNWKKKTKRGQKKDIIQSGKVRVDCGDKLRLGSLI